MSGWQDLASIGERRAAAVLARLVDARGQVPASELLANVPEYSPDARAAAIELEADIDLLRAYGLDIDRSSLGGVSYAIAEPCWQQRPLVLDEIDQALLERALQLAGLRDARLAAAVAALKGHRRIETSHTTVSLSPRGSAARGRPEAYSRLHRLAGMMAHRVTAGFGYPDEDGCVVPRTLQVAGLGESRGVWYAVGTEEGSDVIRAFAVSEMRGPVRELGPEGSYEIPQDFDPAEYLALSWRLGPDPVAARVRFDSTLSAYVGTMLAELPLEETGDGSTEVTLPVGDMDAFVGWVLAFGTHARILEPEVAVQRARQVLAKVVERHG
ncbi:MAG TPA: WYL domain-containing protein [Coriobacteriia bacterium]